MTQFFARSALVLFATSALSACPVSLAQAASSAGQPAAARETSTLLVREADAGAPQLILAAQHRRTPAKHTAAPPAAPTTYTVKKGDTLGKIADRLGVTVPDLKEANHLKSSALQVGQVLTIPGAEPAPTLKSARAAKAAPAAATYTVKQGDTLGKIADQLGVTVPDLKQENGLKSSALQVGKELKIPGAEAKATLEPTRAVRAEPAAPTSYKVKKGETLATIAEKLDVTVAELKQANHLKRSALRAGQVLKVPGAEPKAAPERARVIKAAATTYTVQRGDTLYSIAKKLGVGLDELRAANGLGESSAISVGQKLTLPGSEPAEREAPAPKAKGGKAPAEPQEAAVGQAGGRVVEVLGPARTHKVKKGDTLEKVADALDTDIASLKKANRLNGSMIRPGQVLKGPRSTSKAYVAQSGDTLADVGRRFSVSSEELRRTNGLRRGAALRSGQRLILPAGYHDRGASRSLEERTPPGVRYTPRPPAVEYQTPASPASPAAPGAQPAPGQPYVPSTPRYTPMPTTPGGGPPLAPQAAPPPTDAQISELGRGRFLWPLKGNIISDFGPKPSGERNDGINIQANLGDSVRAAAAGDVIYAGDQVPGFGNLVLLQHPDGWVTAYSHLSKVLVKMQQKVAQGQEVGLAGTTGGVTEPQVHFEVRYRPNSSERARPVDPKLVLPKVTP